MLDYEFNQIDTDGSGFIEASELKTTFHRYDEKLPSSKIDKIIKELDFADNQKINYSEFLAATIDIKMYLNKNRVNAIFSQFDPEDKGYITKSDLKEAFTKFGRELTDQQID